jgi:hypothetical protein
MNTKLPECWAVDPNAHGLRVRISSERPFVLPFNEFRFSECLYRYGYAQGGLNFVHFISANEAQVMARLGKQGYSHDELTAALLSVALAKDMTPICANFGLAVTKERVAQVLLAVISLCRKP